MSASFDMIEFLLATPATIQLQSPLPVINWMSLTIDGPTEDPLDIRINGEGAADPYRIFEIAAGATVTIRDLTISNGLASSGGGIKNSGNLTISNSVIRENVAAQIGNEYEMLGGGIANYSLLTVTNASRIHSNRVKSIQDCQLFVAPGGTDSPLTPCPYRLSGAGVFNEAGAELIVNAGSVIETNYVCHANDFCKVGQFPNNAAEFSGGGIFNRNGRVTITESTIRNNEVKARDPGEALAFRGWGGGIHSECRNVPNCMLIEYSTLSGNVVRVHGTTEDNPSGAPQAQAEGGAISIFGDDQQLAPGSAKIVNSTITGNSLDTNVTGSGCPDDPPPPGV
jgi:hypothetical protein